MDEASLDQPAMMSEATNRRTMNKKALLAVLAGWTVSLAGVLMATNILNIGSELFALSGILILALGLLITSSTLGGIAPSFRIFRGWVLYGRRAGRLQGRYGSGEPRPPEVEAEENKTSAEEQYEDGAERVEREKEHFD